MTKRAFRIRVGAKRNKGGGKTHKKYALRALVIVLVLALYYHYLDVNRPYTVDVYELEPMNKSANILRFEPDYERNDCINLTYTFANATYGDSYKLNRYNRAKFDIDSREHVEEMINSSNDGYFRGDFVREYGALYRIRGAVFGDTCYYSYEKVTLFKFCYASYYRVEGDQLIAEHYLSGWRFALTWTILVIVGLVLYWARDDKDPR